MQVRLPDGNIANFPDDMPREEIKAYIAFKFPDTGLKPNPNALISAIARRQVEKMNAPDPAQKVDGNPYASSLPGPLGQLQNTMAAQQAGMTEGLTANFSNELAAGALAVPNAIGAAAQGRPFDIGQGFNEAYAKGNEIQQGQQALNPQASNIGHVMGTLELGRGLGGLAPKATTPLGMAAQGALEGGAYGAAYGIGGNEGIDRVTGGALGAAQGAVGGAAVGAGSTLFTQSVSPEARLLNKTLTADKVDPSAIPSQMDALGPSGVIADLGPNAQSQAAAIATLPGPGANRIVEALTGRRVGANARIKSDIQSALGVAPSPSAIERGLTGGQDALGSAYEGVFNAKAASANPNMDSQPIIAAIDTVVPRVVGRSRRSIEQVQQMLIDPRTSQPTQDPRVIMAVRRELDGMIGAESNANTARVLSDLRNTIDQDLGVNVPGLKSVDAQYQDLARQKDALTAGKSVLNDGKEALSPGDLVEQMMQMSTPSGVNVGPNNANVARFSDGVKAEIDRIVGTKANDRVALRDIVRGEGSWNYDKLSTILGKDRADALMRIIDREATMAATENLATSGSRTQVLKSAQNQVKGDSGGSGILSEAMNLRFGSAAGKVADKLLGGVIAKSREMTLDNLARALTSRELTPEMQAQVARIRSGATDKEKAIISALLAGQAGR